MSKPTNQNLISELTGLIDNNNERLESFNYYFFANDDNKKNKERNLPKFISFNGSQELISFLKDNRENKPSKVNKFFKKCYKYITRSWFDEARKPNILLFIFWYVVVVPVYSVVIFPIAYLLSKTVSFIFKSFTHAKRKEIRQSLRSMSENITKKVKSFPQQQESKSSETKIESELSPEFEVAAANFFLSLLLQPQDQKIKPIQISKAENIFHKGMKSTNNMTNATKEKNKNQVTGNKKEFDI